MTDDDAEAELLAAVRADYRYHIEAERGAFGLLEYSIVDTQDDDAVICICYDEGIAESVCDHMNYLAFALPDDGLAGIARKPLGLDAT